MIENINITKVPTAILHFFIGVVATYIMWAIVPTILTTMSSLNFIPVSTETEIGQIFWFGMILLSIIYMIGMPTWILFEQD